jgi:hypothetical protein
MFRGIIPRLLRCALRKETRIKMKVAPLIAFDTSVKGLGAMLTVGMEVPVFDGAKRLGTQRALWLELILPFGVASIGVLFRWTVK